MTTSSIRTYSELSRLESYEDRFNYLRIGSKVGCDTFGFNRWINQRFYTSREWRRLRHIVIARDEGCDMGIPGYEIHHRPIIHHMNPLVEADILHGTENALNPEFLITVTHDTHNAIHFGDATQLVKPFVPRSPGDTKLW